MNQGNNQLNVWKLILSGHEATASWGIDSSTLCNIENGISFRLVGENFNGWVEIIFDELDNCFNIFLRNKEAMKLVETIPTAELIAAIRTQPSEIDAENLEKSRKAFGFLKL